MTHRPSDRVKQLENDRRPARRHYPLWVHARDTPADIEAKRNRVIAAGLASADDQFVLVRWNARVKPDGVHLRRDGGSAAAR